jgi:hypothetical protein
LRPRFSSRSERGGGKKEEKRRKRRKCSGHVKSKELDEGTHVLILL